MDLFDIFDPYPRYGWNVGCIIGIACLLWCSPITFPRYLLTSTYCLLLWTGLGSIIIRYHLTIEFIVPYFVVAIGGCALLFGVAFSYVVGSALVYLLNNR